MAAAIVADKQRTEKFTMNDYGDIVYIWYSCKREFFFVFNSILHLTFRTVIHFFGGWMKLKYNGRIENSIQYSIENSINFKSKSKNSDN